MVGSRQSLLFRQYQLVPLSPVLSLTFTQGLTANYKPQHFSSHLQAGCSQTKLLTASPVIRTEKCLVDRLCSLILWVNPLLE